MSTVGYRELLARHTRPSFPWTNVVSQRIGAGFAVAAIRRDVRPAALTVGSLVVAVATSVTALLLLEVGTMAAGLVALVGWQIAYGLDCADGQVARATGTSSTAGARLDVTVDFATGLAVVAVLAAASQEAGLPAPVLAVAAAAWLFPIFDEVSGRDGDADSATVDRGSALYRVLGVVRDGGAVKAVAAVAVGIGPTASASVLGGFGLLWVLLLLARVGFLVRRSPRAGRT